MNYQDTVKMLRSDPSVSYWLKDQLTNENVIDRDPVDALKDAMSLVEILKLKVEEAKRGAGQDSTPLI